jgi:hypothetical protein
LLGEVARGGQFFSSPLIAKEKFALFNFHEKENVKGIFVSTLNEQYSMYILSMSRDITTQGIWQSSHHPHVF